MRVLVTGGGGFLGGHVASLFAKRGDEVSILGRRVYPQAEAAGMASIQADVRDRVAVSQACSGMDVVVHTAGVPGIWGKRKTFWDINYQGTRNVIDACRENGVGRLVFTSSPSVVFGVEPVCGIDESQPYPDRFLGEYSASKAAAERAVLAANGPGLATIALRPHLIWGPGDPHLVPRVVTRARAGQLRQVGDGTNLVDITYIDNAAHAHILATDRLVPGSTCAGAAYFISQGEPVNLWSWIGEILATYGVSWSPRPVSFRTAYRVGAVLETAYRAMGLHSEPRMTRFLATQLGHSHYLDISAARRELGYEPLISTREGMDRLFGSGSGSENPEMAAANADPAVM